MHDNYAPFQKELQYSVTVTGTNYLIFKANFNFSLITEK